MGFASKRFVEDFLSWVLPTATLLKLYSVVIVARVEYDGYNNTCTFWIMKISTPWPSLFSFQCSDFVVTAYVTVYYYYHVW